MKNLLHQMMDNFMLFESFYEEVKGQAPTEETKDLFKEVISDLMLTEREGGSRA